MTKLLRILGKRGRITVPYEIRQRIGLTEGDVLSFVEADDGKTVTVKREKICDNCKDIKSNGSDAIDVLDFLNSLSDEKQRAVVLHLFIKWAKEQEKGGASNG